MSLFAISDTHLSFGTDKPMDVFPGWENYTEKLEKNWKLIINDNDIVVIAGDISWGMNLNEALPDFKFLNELPGKKLIIKGNHDYWWTTVKKMENFFEANGLNTFKFIHNTAYPVGSVCVCGTRGWLQGECEADKKVLLREAGRLKTSIDEAKKTGLEPIAFLHYPPVYDNIVCTEMYSILVESGIKRCYYGHMHGNSAKRAVNEVRDGIRFSLISCDYRDFCPLLIEKI